ncbi:hypothetical protein EDD21DRAFT_171177 [Dissophora ornata]|nr:hypothetical protein EDD21DRAFT_171177 [Dissophora ornata]
MAYAKILKARENIFSVQGCFLQGVCWVPILPTSRLIRSLAISYRLAPASSLWNPVPRGIQLENIAVNVGIFPIGIDTRSLNIKRQDPEVAQWVQVLKKYAGMRLIVARDKLDYIEGVRQKVVAFEALPESLSRMARRGANANIA